MKYAGIGARDTPQSILEYMTAWGAYFGRAGVVLRSGHAKGADQAFEAGCTSVNGSKEIYTPDMVDQFPEWEKYASVFHPVWQKCNESSRRLHARNSPIVIGPALNDPVDFICCWTVDGQASGGTGQALRIARAWRIPIFNFHDLNAHDRLKEFLRLAL